MIECLSYGENQLFLVSSYEIDYKDRYARHWFQSLFPSIHPSIYQGFQSDHSVFSYLVESEWRKDASVNSPSLVRIMACRLLGAKSLSEPFSSRKGNWKCCLENGDHFLCLCVLINQSLATTQSLLKCQISTQSLLHPLHGWTCDVRGSPSENSMNIYMYIYICVCVIYIFANCICFSTRRNTKRKKVRDCHILFVDDYQI